MNISIFVKRVKDSFLHWYIFCSQWLHKCLVVQAIHISQKKYPYRRPKQIFSKEDLANRHIERCSMSLITWEMQIKTAMRYHLMKIRMVIIKSLQIINTGESVEKKEPSYIVGGNENWCSHHEEPYGGSLKTENSYHMIQQFHSWT